MMMSIQRVISVTPYPCFSTPLLASIKPGLIRRRHFSSSAGRMLKSWHFSDSLNSVGQRNFERSPSSVKKTSPFIQHCPGQARRLVTTMNQFVIPQEQWAQVVEKSGGRKLLSPSISCESNLVAHISPSSRLQEDSRAKPWPR